MYVENDTFASLSSMDTALKAGVPCEKLLTTHHAFMESTVATQALADWTADKINTYLAELQ